MGGKSCGVLLVRESGTRNLHPWARGTSTEVASEAAEVASEAVEVESRTPDTPSRDVDGVGNFDNETRHQ
jgi:hypothetical protein